MNKKSHKTSRISNQRCTYKDFLLLYPHCSEEVRNDLDERLLAQSAPVKLCGKELPKDLNSISYGTLDDLRSAAESNDPVSELVKILLDANPALLLSEDVNDVFGFLNFVKKELEKINKLFSSIKSSYSPEEEAAGVHELDFGSFGVLDWYARRMGITNQNEVRDVAWVRIYQCMKNDNLQSEFERRLQQQYIKKNGSKPKKRR